MQYPKKFVERAKAAYPDFARLHQALDAGSEWVGRYLDDSAPQSVSLKEILKAKSLEEVQAKARAVKEKQELYDEWGKLYKIELTRQNQGR